MIYLVTKHHNYGYNKYHEPTVRAFTTFEGMKTAILKSIDDDWEGSDVIKAEKQLDNKEEVIVVDRHYGEYKYDIEQIQQGDFNED